MKISEQFTPILNFIYENSEPNLTALIGVEKTQISIKDHFFPIEKNMFIRCLYYMASSEFITEIMTGTDYSYSLVVLEAKGIDYIESTTH